MKRNFNVCYDDDFMMFKFYSFLSFIDIVFYVYGICSVDGVLR